MSKAAKYGVYEKGNGRLNAFAECRMQRRKHFALQGEIENYY